MSEIRILILDLQDSDTEAMFNFFLYKEERRLGGTVQKLSITSKTIGDFLLIPPFDGYDCTTAGYMGGKMIPPKEVPGLPQWVNLWVQDTMDYYVKKGVPMIGFGYSALLIYERLLGGKIAYDENANTLFAMENKKLALFENNAFFTDSHLGFFGPLYEGLTQFESYLAGHRPDRDEEIEYVRVPV